ncbi:hypothetical protein [Alienimonas californiensis]|uniref:Uncharacterized protein n=1 Tax=Alienimonas californiensis TaxID=2527989 RepID=A0A517P754_9PLAN|nr:hypothetical protein [Alienimonas californiensis]QDT15192.1 hypothetical protein CA12_12730 [Alienimonas californiensis]
MSSRRFAPRLTRGEYWILNSLVEHSHSLCGYGYPDRYLWLLFNRQPHGLSEDELVLTLLGLFNAGWIEGEVDGETTTPFVPDGTTIRAALQSEFDHSDPDWPRLLHAATPPIHLRLTSEGGAVWEAFAEPRWEDFIDDFSDSNEPLENRTVRATRRDHGRQYLRCWAERDRFDPDAVVWKPVSPFPATYWKTLPVGFEAQFRCAPQHASGRMAAAEFERIDALTDRALHCADRFRRWRAWE